MLAGVGACPMGGHGSFYLTDEVQGHMHAYTHMHAHTHTHETSSVSQLLFSSSSRPISQTSGVLVGGSGPPQALAGSKQPCRLGSGSRAARSL